MLLCEWWHVAPSFGPLWPLKTTNIPATCPPYHCHANVSYPMSFIETIHMLLSFMHHNQSCVAMFHLSDPMIFTHVAPMRREKRSTLLLLGNSFPLSNVPRHSQCFNNRGSNIIEFNWNRKLMKYRNFEWLSHVWSSNLMHWSLDALMPSTFDIKDSQCEGSLIWGIINHISTEFFHSTIQYTIGPVIIDMHDFTQRHFLLDL